VAEDQLSEASVSMNLDPTKEQDLQGQQVPIQGTSAALAMLSDEQQEVAVRGIVEVRAQEASEL
jgi:hypothetical protein